MLQDAAFVVASTVVVYAGATIIIFMANWNNYLWPLIALQTNDMKTVTQGIATLLTAYTPDYGVTMIATTLATLPTLFIFFVLQIGRAHV